MYVKIALDGKYKHECHHHHHKYFWNTRCTNYFSLAYINIYIIYLIISHMTRITRPHIDNLSALESLMTHSVTYTINSNESISNKLKIKCTYETKENHNIKSYYLWFNWSLDIVLERRSVATHCQSLKHLNQRNGNLYINQFTSGFLFKSSHASGFCNACT